MLVLKTTRVSGKEKKRINLRTLPTAVSSGAELRSLIELDHRSRKSWLLAVGGIASCCFVPKLSFSTTPRQEKVVVIDNIVCYTEIFAAYHTSTGKALAFTSSSASSHLDSPTQHANSPNSSLALQRSLTSVVASRMKKALRLKSAGSGSKKSLGSGGSGSGPGKPKRVMTVGELMRIQMGISDAMDSRVRRALLRISAAQFNLIKLTMQNVSRMFNFIMDHEGDNICHTLSIGTT
ncbi:unnamed protein product [Prunus armeniaca]